MKTRLKQAGRGVTKQMLGVESPADPRRLALNVPQARSPERCLTLHETSQGDCATAVAARTGRHAQTLMAWPEAYKENGPEALLHRRTGGRTLSPNGGRA